MQMSTRQEDFIVDTIKLKFEIQEHLGSIFDNPSVVKVLHGSDMDVEWLQRDLGLYVVNMFDTGQCARVLGLKSCSLAFLLQSFCTVLADKKYQLADWRQRPLPDEMQKYAREDTHYLLYIYDCLRNQLLEKGAQNNAENPQAMYRAVLHRSNAICLKIFEKSVVKDFNYHMIV